MDMKDMNKELNKLYSPLQSLNNIRCRYFQNKYGSNLDYFWFNRAENGLRALEIIKRKRVDISSILVSKNLNSYKYFISYSSYFQYDEITEEEFNLLKEAFYD